MELADAVDALGAGDAGQARDAIRAIGSNQGFSRAYFDRIQTEFGHRPAEAARLASRWRLLLQLGDDPALAYRTKGVADRLDGRWLDSAKAFRRAGTTAGSERERLANQVGAVDSLARAGKVSEAVTLGKALVQGLDRLGEPGLAGRVKLNVGHALLWIDRYREASRWLSEAAAALRAAGLVADEAYAELSLSTAQLFSGSLLDARSSAQSALEMAASHGLDFAQAQCRLNLAHVDLLAGNADRALEAFLSLRTDFAHSKIELARLNEFIGDAYLRLNLWPEAILAYEEALAAKRVLPALNVASCKLGIGQARLAESEPDLAMKPLREARNAFLAASNVAWASGASCLLAKALDRVGRKSEAMKASDHALTLARQSRSSWYELEAILTSLELVNATEAAPPVSLPVRLRKAYRLASRNGYRSQIWRAEAAKARLAPAERRLPALRLAFREILASRALTSSQISRAAFLRDKRLVISDYLEALLASPSKSRIREAIQAISQCRSAALLDEILATRADAFSKRNLEELDELREELRQIEESSQLPGGTRRDPHLLSAAHSVQRRWIEATHATLPSLSSVGVSGCSADVTFAALEREVIAIEDWTLRYVTRSPGEFAERLRWLSFELMSPMVDAAARDGGPNALLKALGGELFNSGGMKDSISICPDGLLWNAPWSACLAAIGSEAEPVIALHPSFHRLFQGPLDRDATALLWVGSDEDIPNAELECEAFLEIFPCATVCRNAAEANASLSGRFDLLHVIAHSSHNARNPMFSKIRFSDGAIFAAQIAQSAFYAKIISLSACETGALSTAIADEPNGLVRSFLALGAETVIGSLWALDDEAAHRFSASFFKDLRSGHGIVAAMRCARLAVRSWRDHPYFWGAPTLFGGY